MSERGDASGFYVGERDGASVAGVNGSGPGHGQSSSLDADWIMGMQAAILADSSSPIFLR